MNRALNIAESNAISHQTNVTLDKEYSQMTEQAMVAQHYIYYAKYHCQWYTIPKTDTTMGRYIRVISIVGKLSCQGASTGETSITVVLKNE